MKNKNGCDILISCKKKGKEINKKMILLVVIIVASVDLLGTGISFYMSDSISPSVVASIPIYIALTYISASNRLK